MSDARLQDIRRSAALDPGAEAVTSIRWRVTRQNGSPELESRTFAGNDVIGWRGPNGDHWQRLDFLTWAGWLDSPAAAIAAAREAAASALAEIDVLAARQEVPR